MLCPTPADRKRIKNWFEQEAQEFDLLTRLLRLRKAGLIGPVLAEMGVYYICTNELNPWGSRERWTQEELWDLVHHLEGTNRKPAQSEKRAWRRAKVIA